MNCGSPTRAGDIDHFPREHPALKTAPFVWLTGFVRHLPLRERGEREAALAAGYTADGRPHRRAPLGPERERDTRQHLFGRGSDTADRMQSEGESSAGKSGYDCIVTYALTRGCAWAHRQTACWRTPPHPG